MNKFTEYQNVIFVLYIISHEYQSRVSIGSFTYIYISPEKWNPTRKPIFENCNAKSLIEMLAQSQFAPWNILLLTSWPSRHLADSSYNPYNGKNWKVFNWYRLLIFHLLSEFCSLRMDDDMFLGIETIIGIRVEKVSGWFQQ